MICFAWDRPSSNGPRARSSGWAAFAVEGLRLLLWRAATDNDLGAEWGSPDPRPVATQWLDAGLNRMHTRLIGISSRPVG